ncbi:MULTISPECIES: hypothetical protein [unclassified Oceanobacillus]|nr:hypothetical protein [Oceanobacillus sp. AG]
MLIHPGGIVKEKDKESRIEPEVDFVVIYTGIQGLSKADDKGGFYGPKP